MKGVAFVSTLLALGVVCVGCGDSWTLLHRSNGFSSEEIEAAYVTKLGCEFARTRKIHEWVALVNKPFEMKDTAGAWYKFFEVNREVRPGVWQRKIPYTYEEEARWWRCLPTSLVAARKDLP